MVAVFVLVAGVLLIMVVGGALFIILGMAQVLASLVPFGPALVAVGSLLLILAELLLFFGNKEDRVGARRNLVYMVPTFILSAALWWVAQYFLW